jgi:hypothetical protein
MCVIQNNMLNNTTHKYQVGDVIYIEANSGAVKRVGRCDAYATEFDLEAEEYVPLPKVRVGGRAFQHSVCSNVGVGGCLKVATEFDLEAEGLGWAGLGKQAVALSCDASAAASGRRE